MATSVTTEIEQLSERDRTLLEVQDRVLWLAMNMVYYANNVRPSLDSVKVGGHQASSSSVASILTSLYFDFMRAGDRISIKPHASPTFHAIQYLLGNLDPSYLKTLRGFHGLQSYPSRTKDPDPVDFSTGSVGIGSIAPNFAALSDDYARSHGYLGEAPVGRYISLLGDAELDEGSVWECIAEPAMAGLSNVLWVIDLNRQSLDRIIPGIRVKAWRSMFRGNGWKVVDAKYGKRLQAAFRQPNGELLRTAIDDMSNEVYQRLLRVSPETLREWLPRTSAFPEDMKRLIDQWDDRELQEIIRNLGGHDFSMLREAFSQVDVSDGPCVVFAYTLKGWMLPSIGDPQNHSVVLSEEQMAELKGQLGVADGEEWSAFDPDSAPGRLCGATAERLRMPEGDLAQAATLEVPASFDRAYRGQMSTQQMFGLVLTDIGRSHPDLGKRIVTVSPDVASSTNLGGWINRVGVWHHEETEPLPDDEIIRALKWDTSRQGQHIELGISENNLFMMLGQLGLTHEMHGELLFPLGTVYDPFIRRGLDAFFYGVYSGSRFIVIGTPSGITLGPEGGAHQSIVTPSVGIEMPELDFYEPCFGRELEWIMLSAMEQIRLRKRSTYLRLTSYRVDQGLMPVPDDPADVERLRLQVLAGAYRLVDRSGEPDYNPGENVVHVMTSGAVIPEVIDASDRLLEEGIFANVINVTGPGPLYRKHQEIARAFVNDIGDMSEFMSDVVPAEERSAPVVTVVDGHPHSLAWIGGALSTTTIPLGVTEFGQSGSRPELYKEYGIDADSVIAAAFAALGM